jgi:hypothetical protein
VTPPDLNVAPPDLNVAPPDLTTPAVLGAPTGVAAVANLRLGATVTWTAPASDGGSPILRYEVTASPGGATQTTASATTQLAFGMLSVGSYTFTVKAINAVGTGPASSPSNAVKVGDVPPAPTIGTATAVSANIATVTWTPPASDANHPITSYVVTSNPGGITVTASGAASNNVIVGGLTLDVSYTFTVVAQNDLGDGSASAPSNAIIAGTVPAAPTIGTAVTLSGGRAHVRWTPPSSNVNHPILDYTIYASAGVLTAVIAGAASADGIIGGLADGGSYTFTVKARNDLGYSLDSAPTTSIIATAGIVDTLYVANYGSTNKIEIFEEMSTLSSGSTSTRFVQGANTTISSPAEGSLFVDGVANVVYLTNQSSGSGTPAVTIWNNAQSIGVTGQQNIAPDRTIVGSNTGLTGSFARGIYLDRTHNRLYVSGRDYVVAFANGTTVNQNAAFAAKLTNVSYVEQLFVNEATDELYLANSTNILVYSNASSLSGTVTAAAGRSFTVGSGAHFALCFSGGRLWTATYSGSAAATSIYHMANPGVLTGSEVPGPAQTMSNMTGVFNVSAMHVANDWLIAPNDFSTTLNLWSSASSLSGSPAPTKTLTTTGPTTAVFYVP